MSLVGVLESPRHWESRRADLEVRGWVHDSHGPLTAVEADVGGAVYPLSYGHPRPDVDARRVPGADASRVGFEGRVPLGARDGVVTSVCVRLRVVSDDGRRHPWIERVVRLDRGTTYSRVGNVVAGAVSAVRGAWRERRWPGPPSTWPATIAFLWRGGPVRAARSATPATFDAAAFDASFAAHGDGTSVPARESPTASSPLTIVALARDESRVHALVAALADVDSTPWTLWVVPLLADPIVWRFDHPAVRVVDPHGRAAAWLPPADAAETVVLLDASTLPVPAGVRAAVVEREVSDARWVYVDDARRDARGRLHDVYLKGGFSPALALVDDYAARCGVTTRQTLASIGGLDFTTGASCVRDLLLRLATQPGGVAHADAIGAVRTDSGEAPSDAAWLAAGSRALGSEGAVVLEDGDGVSARARVVWTGGGARTEVTVVVPSRDRPSQLRACLAALARTTDPARTRVVVVDDGSERAETAELLASLPRLVPYPIEVIRPAHRDGFNYAQLVNIGTARVTTPLVLHLNDDVEAIEAGWLDQLAGWCTQPGVGVVGARLIHRDGSLQHGGVVVATSLGGPDHAARGLAPGSGGYQGLMHKVRDVSAVTGACLLTRVALYRELRGFDADHFRVQFNDTDYCLRARAAGWRVIYEPAAVLLHDESSSRGRAVDLRENVAFMDRYGSYVEPYWSARLDPDSLLGPTPLVAPRPTR